jgi:mutator protein MutT
MVPQHRGRGCDASHYGGAVRCVVGAAVLSHGRLLAARRVAPAGLAGGWELPGGKVEPGEHPEQALVREVREELGCEIEVVDALPGTEPLGPGVELRAYVCRLVDGEPLPREHDAVRWLGPEQLHDVGWLPADVGFVDALRHRLLDGERLPGGNVGGAVRIGATVRRPTGPWTGVVHDLMRHLERAGLPGVPRVLGADERGREVVSYLPGVVRDPDDWTPDDELLADAVAWLRRFHRAVADFRPSGTVRWRAMSRVLGEHEIVCHHDCGTYNWVVDDGRFAGMIDWDVAGPGVALDDVAFLAWTGVPLYREAPAADVVRRLRLVTETYGDGVDAEQVAVHAVARMTGAADRIAAGQAAGDTGMVSLRRIGEPARTQARVASLRARLPGLRRALSQGPLRNLH